MSGGNNLSFSKSGDQKTLTIDETMGGKMNNAEQRAAFLSHVREEERARVEARREAEDDYKRKQAEAELHAAQAAALEAAEAQSKKAAEEAEKDPASAKLVAMEASIAKMTQAFENTQKQMLMAELAKGVWKPASAKAHLVPGETNIQPPPVQTNTNFSEKKENLEKKDMENAAPPAEKAEDESARIKKLVAEMLQAEMSKQRTATAPTPPAEETVAVAEEQKRKRPAQEFLDDDDFDLAMDDMGDGLEEAIKGNSVKEEIKAVMLEMDERRKDYIKVRDKLVNDIDRYKKERDDMDEEPRIKRGGILEKRKAEFVDMSKSVKDWFASQMAKYGNATDDEEVRKVYADTVGTFKAKRGYLRDEDLDTMKTHLITAAASSKNATENKRTLTSLHKQLVSTRREKESARYEAEQLNIRSGAKQTVLADDPRNKMRGNAPAAKKAKTAKTELSFTAKQERDFCSVAYSAAAFKPHNARIISAASSLTFAEDNEDDQEGDNFSTASSVADGEREELTEVVRKLVGELSDRKPEAGMWVQRRPQMADLPVTSASGGPLYSSTYQRGSVLHPPREINGLNNPRTRGQWQLLNNLMEYKESNPGKEINHEMFIKGQNDERKEEPSRGLYY